MGIANNTFGYPADAVRVRFRYTNDSGATKTIYQGEPMCYVYDTTNNILGWDKENEEAGSTTAEGYQNEGKFLIVENVAADNMQWFAGVVAEGSWCGKQVADGSSEDIELYLANGGIVAVRTDCNCTVGTTPLCLASGSQEFTSVGRPVGLAEETKDRSGTNGIVLAKIDPNLFLYQTDGDTAMSFDDELATTTGIVNQMYMTEAQTAGSFVPLYMHHTSTGNTSAAMNEYNILSYLSLSGTYDQTGYHRGILSQVNIGGTVNAGCHIASIMAQLTEGASGTVTNVEHMSGLWVDCTAAKPSGTDLANHYSMVRISNGADAEEGPDEVFYVYGGNGIEELFDFDTCLNGGGATDHFIYPLGTGADKIITSGTDGTTLKVKCDVDGTAYYLILYADPTEAAN